MFVLEAAVAKQLLRACPDVRCPHYSMPSVG